MAKVFIMDSHLANMIAAGEVIERPSSVVKELVENSIDSGAKHIEVRIYEAGRKKIIVKDDGCGMDKVDAVTAFKRHASSKLKSERDLFKIKTMGFRGEALPSISSVSKVTMITNDGSIVGTKVIIENDQLKVEECAARKGTIFTVEELFYNTPVRLKFLKTDVTENANTLEVMQRLAMARCDIAFDFYIDDKLSFSTSGRGDLLEVISRIYSNDVARKMIKVSLDDFDYQVEGYIGLPESAKSTRYYMITLLNERNVYLPKVQKALIEAYGDFIFNTKYPFVVLKIKVEHSLVDVNVHPSKKEVRLSNEEKMCDGINKMVKEALRALKPLTSASIYKESNGETNHSKNDSLDNAISSPSQKKSVSLLLEDDSIDLREPLITRPTIQAKKTEQEEIVFDLSSLDEDVKPSVEQELRVNKSFRKPELKPLGQIHNTYIICEGEDGMYVIDQHAANERINYEKFDRELNNNINVVEPLIPYVINLNPSEIMKLTEERLMLLKEIGIECGLFGSNSIRVVKLPVFMKEVDEGVYLEELITQVLIKDRVDISMLRKHVIATMACKASIKANDKLSLIEMNDLIDSLFECDNPTTCPHGRPTIVHFSKYDIEKMFKRTGI